MPLPDLTNDHDQTILIRISGPDRPGITAEVMELLGQSGATLADVEQIVIRGKLILSLVVDLVRGHDVLRELLVIGWRNGLDIDFEMVEQLPTRHQPGLVVTVLDSTVRPVEFAALAAATAAAGGNIDRIIRLARYPVMAYELLIRSDDPDRTRAALLSTAKQLDCDVAVHREGLGRRSKRLVMMDVDSTLIQDEMIDLLAEEADVGAEVAEITERAMAGELDFAQSLRARVALLAGLEAAALERVTDRIKMTPGAATFCRTLARLGYQTAIVSGGFISIAEHLRERLGIDEAYANRLEVVDGRLTGNLIGEIVDRQAKANIMVDMAKRHGIPLEQVVAVGDGANDLDMLSAAGLGIAFNAKPVVAHGADTAVTVPYLDAILFVLGVRREDIEDADLSLTV